MEFVSDSSREWWILWTLGVTQTRLSFQADMANYFTDFTKITALHVAPEIHRLTFDGDGCAFRLREAHYGSENHDGESGDDG